MVVSTKVIGTYKGQDVKLFELTNSNNMTVKVMNYGATITSVTIPDADGKSVQMVCGFDKFEDYFSEEYIANAPYFGCTVGRYCSQIKDAHFELDGEKYQLAKNCNANNLHGGTEGFDKKIWSAEAFELNDVVGVEFSLFSADMEEGFPGNVEAKVIMELNNDNEISIQYSAKTDKATPLSFTNHSYWNLSGFKTNVEGFKVKVNSDQLMTMDDTGAATGEIKQVANTPEDLSEGPSVRDVQAAIGGGFEHFYVFDNPVEALVPVAEVIDPVSKRSLQVSSTEPCMLFYTANYMSDKLMRNADEQYGQFRAFACETHRYQNGPNILNSPGTFTYPDKEFNSTTVFKLNW